MVRNRSGQAISVLGKPVLVAKSVARRILSFLTSPRAAFLIGEVLFSLMGRRGRRQDIDLSTIKRVLVVRLDRIGDVVMTTPFLRELRRNLPDARITLVVQPAIYNLVGPCPYVNQVLTYDGSIRGRLWQLRRHGRALKLAWKYLWQRRFDLAILPRWDTDYYHSSFVLYFSGAPSRVGYSENVNTRKKRRNVGFDCLFTHVLDDNVLKHEVERNLEMIRFLGGEVQDDRLELWLSEEDKDFAELLLRNHQVKPGDLLIGMAPGAGAPNRSWPIDRFAELSLWLQKEYGARLLVVGGPGEEPLGEELEQELGSCVINTAGRTTLRQVAALLQRCELFVGDDAGPMHIAAAVGVPVVEISCHPESGSPWSINSPLRFGPWGIDYTVAQPKKPAALCVDECVADRPHCILGITVEQVRQPVAKHLRQVHTVAGKD